MPFEKVTIRDCVLYRGDCLEILPTLGKVDAVVTDPPYGVGFKYDSHDDTNIGYIDWCEKWHTAIKKLTNRIAVSCGIANLQNWPKPDWTFCWHKPASMGRCVVGFNNWEPVIFYGKTPRQVVDVFRACIIPDDTLSDHPCPKPLGWATSLIDKVSNFDETILDPFMGSGTTGVACVKLDRKFIGIEIEPKYFDIACKQIERAYADQALLDMMPAEPEQQQAELFEEVLT